MAIVSVTKWSEIATAISEATEDITINITKNINLVDEFIYGVTSSIEVPNNITVTIEGNNHKIINLSNDLNLTDGIFVTVTAAAHSDITIQNLNFVNLVLNNLALIKATNAADEVELINCGFVGKRNGTSYLIDAPSSLQAKFTSCFFDIPWQGAGQNPSKYLSLVTNPTSTSAVTNFEAEYCWFREHYTNWTLKRWSCVDVNSTTTSTIWSFFYIKINGCYIDGDMTMLNDSHSNKNTHVPIDVQHHANYQTSYGNFIPTVMSVFDVDVTVAGTWTTADRGNFFGLYVNKLINENDELITTWDTSYDSTSSKPYPIIATEGQAANEAWLRDHGFAI